MTLADMAAVGGTTQGAAASPLALRGPTQRTMRAFDSASCSIHVSVLIRLADALSVPDGGFSITTDDYTDVRAGYAVSVFPQWEQRITGLVTSEDIASYAASVGRELTRPGLVLGGWRSPGDGTAYLDMSIVVLDRHRALALARAHTQLAIWDFAASVSIVVEPVQHAGQL